MRTLLLFLVSVALPLSAAEPVPLRRAHAHNDYEHARPLLDALERGFCNVEADIHLVDGRLLVAHDRKDVKPERTLAALYLDPLHERVRRHGGHVFATPAPVVLLVDVKTEAAATYAALHAVLAGYSDMLTTFEPERISPGAVTVIVSGNRAVKEMAAQRVRWAAVDGRADDLDVNPPATIVPWISENWKKVFRWNWEGPIPEAERLALVRWVQRAQVQGRAVRFWNTPDRPEAWKILLDAGVDVIGTDDLAGLQRFFAERSGR